MAFIHYTVTLTGSAQNLETDLPAGTPDRCRTLILQVDPSNSGLVYVGGSGLTDSNFAFSLPIPVGGKAAPPFMLGDYETTVLRLDDIYVLGSASDKLYVSAVVN